MNSEQKRQVRAVLKQAQTSQNRASFHLNISEELPEQRDINFALNLAANYLEEVIGYLQQVNTILRNPKL